MNRGFADPEFCSLTVLACLLCRRSRDEDHLLSRRQSMPDSPGLIMICRANSCSHSATLLRATRRLSGRTSVVVAPELMGWLEPPWLIPNSISVVIAVHYLSTHLLVRHNVLHPISLDFIARSSATS